MGKEEPPPRRAATAGRHGGAAGELPGQGWTAGNGIAFEQGIWSGNKRISAQRRHSGAAGRIRSGPYSGENDVVPKRGGGAAELPLSNTAWKSSGDYSNRNATAGRFLYGRATGAVCEQRHNGTVGCIRMELPSGGTGSCSNRGQEVRDGLRAMRRRGSGGYSNRNDIVG